MSDSGTGEVSGTPNAAGTSSFVVHAQDAVGDVPQHHIMMYVAPLGGRRVLVGDPAAPARTYSKIGAWVRGFEFDWKRWRIPPTVAAAQTPSHALLDIPAIGADSPFPSDDAGYGCRRVSPVGAISKRSIIAWSS